MDMGEARRTALKVWKTVEKRLYLATEVPEAFAVCLKQQSEDDDRLIDGLCEQLDTEVERVRARDEWCTAKQSLIRNLQHDLAYEQATNKRHETCWRTLQSAAFPSVWEDRPLTLGDLKVGMQVEAWSFFQDAWTSARVCAIDPSRPWPIQVVIPAHHLEGLYRAWRDLDEVRVPTESKDLKLKKERIGCLEMELGMQRRRIEELEGMLEEAKRRALATDFWKEPEPKLKLDDFKVGMEVEAWSLENEKWLPSRVSEIIPAGLYKVRVVWRSSEGGLRNLNEIRMPQKPEPSPNLWEKLPCPNCRMSGAIFGPAGREVRDGTD